MAKSGFELRPGTSRALPSILHKVTESILELSLTFTVKRNLLPKAIHVLYVYRREMKVQRKSVVSLDSSHFVLWAR